MVNIYTLLDVFVKVITLINTILMSFFFKIKMMAYIKHFYKNVEFDYVLWILQKD